MAIVLSFIARAHAMETQCEETNYFPQELTCHILRHASMNKILDLGTDVSFKDVYGDMRLVCKNWQCIIDNGIDSHKTGDTWNQKKKDYWVDALVSAYESIGHGDDCRLFLNGEITIHTGSGRPYNPMDHGQRKTIRE